MVADIGLPVAGVIELSLKGVLLEYHDFDALGLDGGSRAFEAPFGFLEVELALDGDVFFLLGIFFVLVVVVARLAQQRVERVEPRHDLLHVHIELV